MKRAALKHQLKTWELAFFSKHGRRPIPADIAQDPIAKLYRQYENTKRSATDATCESSNTLTRSQSVSKGSVSQQHLERICKGFSFLNQTTHFPSTSPHPGPSQPGRSLSDPTTQSELSKTAIVGQTFSEQRLDQDENLDPAQQTPAALRFRRNTSLPRAESFVSPLTTLSRTVSKISLPESDDEAVQQITHLSADAHQPSLQLGELADKYQSAAAAGVFVPESYSDQVLQAPVTLPQSASKSRRSVQRTSSNERLTLTNNYVKYDLKHDWKSKTKTAKKSTWKSAKMFAIEMKKKRFEEHNAALYTEMLEDDLRLFQIQRNLPDVTNELDEDEQECHPDFKRRRMDEPKAPHPPAMQDVDVDTVDNSEFTREHASSVLADVFGFLSFRPNQFEVIERIMQRKSTFAVLPTGAGKSLLYQMPAYLLPGVCLVMTPLISLMKDQLQHLPDRIPGAIWSSNETVSQVHELIQKLRSAKIKVLFLSPERLQSAGFRRIIQSLPPPGVSFACVDEAHCVSQWAHNFRPAFSRVGKVLRMQFGVGCILSLTATATKQTLNSVCSVLSLSPQDVMVADVRRDNLILSVSRENDRFAALVQLLNSERFCDLSSIIVYVHQQRTADEIMFRLRTYGIDAVSYHAGKDAKTRRAIQEQFMLNKARIICATIAFGMGLDKRDVRAIIHFNCPQSMEHYVQEIGRAGRDGLPAFCHAFYDEDDVDRFRSLAFSNGVDSCQVIKFLNSIFDGIDEYGESYFVALSISKQVQAYDLREEIIETFLTFLELESDVEYVRAHPMIHNTCTIRFLKTSQQQLAQADPILAEILNQSRSYSGSLSVNIVKVSNALHVSVADVQRTLLTLKSLGQISAVWKDLCFCIEVVKRPDNIEALSDDLVEFCRQHATCKNRKVNIVAQILKSVATEKCLDVGPDCQSRLQRMISTYFVCDNDEQLVAEAELLLPDYESLDSLCQQRPRPHHLIGDIKVLLLQWKNKVTTPRQVARILHGISSPKFPYKEWCKYPAWGKYVSYPFQHLLADATMVLESLERLQNENEPRQRLESPNSTHD